MAIEGRFYVEQVTRHASFDGLAVVMRASMKGEANKAWAKFTPSGKIEMTVTDPGVAKWLESRLGKDVSVMFDDIRLVEAVAEDLPGEAVAE